MITYTYTKARQNFKEILDLASKEEVAIKRRGGETYSIKLAHVPDSPFKIKGIKTKISTSEIINAVRESRKR